MAATQAQAAVRCGVSLALVLLGLAGCRASRSVAPSEAVVVVAEPYPVLPDEGYAVLPWGTQVYLEPRLGGASARLGQQSAAPPQWPSPGYAVRVVGSRDGFVEIAPLLQVSQAHCGMVLDAEVFDVRLHVSPWALAPVLMREVEALDEDGSALSLRPGALVRSVPDDPRGRWAVWAGGIRMRAAVPEDAIGLVYAEPQPVVSSGSGAWRLPDGRPFSYGGSPLEIDPAFGYMVTISSVVPRAEGFRVELVSPCGRVLADATQAPPAQWEEPMFEFGLGGPDEISAALLQDLVEPEPEPVFDAVLEVGSASSGQFDLVGSLVGGAQGGRILGSSTSLPERVFEEGAPVYLSTAGPAAGTLSQMRVFSEEGWIVGDRLCFRTSFGAHFSPLLPVCLAADEAHVRNPVVDVYDFGPGSVRPGSIQLTGALSEPAVARALRRQRADLRRCWGEALSLGVQGTNELALALELDVNGKGAVTHVRVGSPFIAGLTTCAVAAAQRWTMPPTDDGKPAKVVVSVRLGLR